MEFYSNTKPQLTNFKLQKDFSKVINKPNAHCTVNDNITNLIINIYKGYIQPNFLLLLMIFIICFILYQRYVETKKLKKEQLNEKTEVEDILDKLDEENTQILYPGIGHVPTLNPLHSNESQQENNFPINIPINGNKLTYPNTYNTHNTQQTIRNLPNYNYNNVYENPSRNYYSGTTNTYQNALDTSIQNAHGYVPNYNTSTNNFGDFSTNNNNNNAIAHYNKMLNSTNNDLIDNLQYGPLNLDVDSSETTMEPPYATE